MADSDRATLVEFLEAQKDPPIIYPFYEYLLENERAFREGELPTPEMGFAYNEVDILYPLFDAVTYGILAEQESPAAHRESPDDPYFDRPNGFGSTEEVIDAQPQRILETFFRFFRVTESLADPAMPPPPVEYQGVQITAPLHNAVVFGAQWEMWHADDLAEEYDAGLPV